MTDNWRFLDLGVINPYESEAVEEVIIKARRSKLIPNTMLIRIPERYVEIGPKVSLNRVDVEYCRSEGIPIVREAGLGSSIVIFDGDIIYCNLVSDLVLNGVSLDRKTYMECVVKSLQILGLNAYIKEKSNDIFIDGKKVSGNAAQVIQEIFIAGGSIIMSFDYDFCEKAIREVKNHRDWVTTLKTQLGREVSYSEVVSALRMGFEEVLQIEFEASNTLTETEERMVKDLQVKYRSDVWLKYGKWSPIKDYWRPT